ncbi:hypothetical protein O1W68_07675 [Rhodococcus sp. H36-A4]|uniref:hypothetical protein n=1 Tax=Rhodococcus sp. H36-A4 TaxID=3004353 RepID=UPI0022AF58D1|nr:hypothetical protein [Rhodococcus sp. H36-A4]MCZ4077814.1 hypothetical protein [Rhodococcus sp. H36-A4]
MSTDRLEQLRQRPITSLTGMELQELKNSGFRYNPAFGRWVHEPGYIDPAAWTQAQDATADEWDGLPVPEWAVRNYSRLTITEFRFQLERRKVVERLVNR